MSQGVSQAVPVAEVTVPAAAPAKEHEEQLSGNKRKTPEKKLGRFKIVGQLVLAMQRFKGEQAGHG